MSGSIPAGAGEPGPIISVTSLGWVYPRGCGGAKNRLGITEPVPGLSPRVRGSPAFGKGHDAATGSIPAGAGEPLSPPHASPSVTVYPRGCGGAKLGLCR